MEHRLRTPLLKKEIQNLRAGDTVLFNGVLYSARDAAHRLMAETLQNGGALPIEIENAVIYYMGPSPARSGRPIGSAGPTTSSRMDKYTPVLLNLGLSGMIGKGRRSDAVKEAIVQNRAVYFAAIGGAGALLSHRITKSEVVAYPHLGTEAIHRLYVEEFPAIVIVDAFGNDLYADISGRMMNRDSI